MIVWIAKNLSIPVMNMLGSICSAVDFSVGEMALLTPLVLIAAAVAGAIVCRKRRKAAARFAKPAIGVICAFLLSYALIWLPLSTYSRFDGEYARPEPEGLYIMSIEFIQKANEQREYYSPQLEFVASRVADDLYDLTGRKSVIKTSRMPWWMRKLSLAGICLPWSGEAVVRPDIPAVALPFVMAHEGAHQIGYGPEAEANYAAYMALEGDDKLNYSATMYALYYSLDALRTLEPAYYNGAVSAMSKAVFDDYATIAAFSRGKTGAQGAVAEAFLRLSGQSGLDSYGEMVGLLINRPEI
ncbi:MAG: DUF3810 family protein [Clostridia bacterium]|nr:DUF3810 family protein [Clostridia bacterium]